MNRVEIGIGFRLDFGYFHIKFLFDKLDVLNVRDTVISLNFFNEMEEIREF